MKKVLPGLFLALVLLLAGAYLRTLIIPIGTQAFGDDSIHLEAKTNLLTDAGGEAFTGTLQVAYPNLKEFALAYVSMSRGQQPLLPYLPSRPEVLDDIRFKGLMICMDVKEGKANGEARLYLDLRDADAMLLDRDLGKGISYYLAYAFYPLIQIAEAQLADNALEGEAKIWLPKEEKSGFYPKASVTFQNNQLQGEALVYHSNGNVYQQLNFEQGRREGWQRTYYKSGKLRMEQELSNNRAVQRKSYYESDQLSSHIVFGDGYSPDTVEEWFPDGSQKKISRYPNDSTHVYQVYYSNGKLAEEKHNGRIQKYPPDGQVISYYPNGQIQSDMHYNSQAQEDGAYTRYYASGQKWEEGKYVAGQLQGSIKKWYTNGQIAEDHTMVGGKIDGPYIRYYYNGELWKKGSYRKGVLSGAYEKWFNNGQLAYSYNYTNGKLDGEYMKWYTDGTLRLHCFYKEGKLHGKYDNWNADGSLYRSAQYAEGKEVK